MKNSQFKLLLVALFAPLMLMGQSMEERDAIIKADGKYFANSTYTQLKNSYRLSGIRKIKDPALKAMAEQVFEGTYDFKYRAAEYEAYPSKPCMIY